MKKGHIIKSFSTAFEQPQDGDTFIEDGGRHYNLKLLRSDGLPALKYVNGEIVPTTDADLAEEIAAIVPPDPNLSLNDRVSQLEIIVLQDNGVIE